MGFGRYRFRRSFGNVSSQFRGATPKHYPLFTGVLDTYPGAAAAYSLRALSRGWLAGDVVEVRRSSDSASQDFTASQIDNGAMLDFVNHDTTSLYNSARYFDGVDTEVAPPSIIDFGTGNWRVGATVNLPSTASPQPILGSGVQWVMQLSTATTLTCRTTLDGEIFNIVLDTPYGNGTTTKFEIERSGNTLYAYVDGVQQGSTSTCDTADTFSFKKVGNRGSVFCEGLIYDVNINNQVAYTGLGTSVTAWEDTIGSNDGTETNGAAYTGQPFDGYVSKWYDQSGNANDATQPITTAQPKIVDAGALVVGGIDFDGVDDYLEANAVASSFTGDDMPLSSFSVATPSTPANQYIWALGNSASDGAFNGAGDGIGVYRSLERDDDYDLVNINGGTFTSESIVTYITTGNQRELFGGGASIGSDATDLSTKTLDRFQVGRLLRTTSTGFWNGKIQEIIIYHSDQSANREGIETNINDYYSIY